MSWIHEIEYDEAADELREIYDELVKSRGKVANVLRVQSLLPTSIRRHMDLYMTLMFDRSGLTRDERELIAVAVSVENGCDYCLCHHSEALHHYWKSHDRIRKVIEEDGDAHLSNRQLGMVEYSRKLTANPEDMNEGDVEKLRRAGLKDHEILSVNLIAGYFNFVNRLALGLGVEFTPDEVSGYKY